MVAGVAACAPEASPPTPTEYSVAAEEVGWWLLHTAPGAVSELPDEVGGDRASAGLGSGMAGRALFFAELFVATGDTAHRAAAVELAQATVSGAAPPEVALGLYNGLAGMAFAVSEVGRVTEDSALSASANELFDRLTAGASLEPEWGPAHDVLVGKAGIGFALLYAHDRFGDEAYLDAATQVGDALLGVGEASTVGTRWMRGADTPMDLPNFSHGTAGVGAFLARLGRASGEARFLEGARSAVRYLDAVSDTTGGLYLIPYGVPNEGLSTAYDIGWAHGPAGSARLFYELTEDIPGPSDRTDRLVETLRVSGIPGPSSDPQRWTGPFPLDRRFGSAGAAVFLSDWSRLAGDPDAGGLAGAIMDTVVARSTLTPDGRVWSVPRYGFQGGEGDGRFTGYFYGSAGFGLALLHQHYAELGEWPAIRFPDDPFPSRSR